MLNRRQIIGTAFAAAAFPGVAFASSPEASPVANLAARIDALIADQTVDIPFTGVALVTVAGVPVLDAAYGFADGVTRTPNTTDTGFQIASITKTMTAALTVQLRDEGAFALDDPASALLPRFADQLDSGASPVTVRHLLNHTSGVPDFLELYDVFDIEHYPESLDVLLDRIAIEPLRFEPATEFLYSNSGYLYLGRIIEAVTGETWEEALAKRITGPLDLDRTWLTPPDNRGPLATGYLQLDGLVLPVSRLGRPDLAESAGGLTSTTSDLLAWVDAYMAGSVVDLDSVEEMLAPDLADYGLGWETIRVDGVEWHGHYGQTIGFCSALARQREHNATVILLSNRQDFPISHLHRQVMETLQRS